MGPFIEEIGTLDIPEDRRKDFLEDARIVAKEGGLFQVTDAELFGKSIWLLSFPDFRK